jgi:signal transduction histidine kinase
MFTGSRKFVLVALFTAVLIVLVNLAWWFYYQRTEQLLDNQLSRRLSAIAASAAVALDTTTVDLLVAGDIDTYLRVSESLQRVRRADSLAEVFILGESYQYLASTDLEPDSVYFFAGLNSSLLDSLFFGQSEAAVVSPTYRSGDLLLKSAFAPLVNSQGIATAVLGVEANVDYFESLRDLKRNLYYASGLSLAGGVLLGLLFLLLQRRINTAEQQLFLGQTHAHLGRMVAVVAHELKNPLMIMRGSAERIARKTDMPEAQYMIEEVDRLNGIVSGYLDFARAGGSLLAGDSLQAVALDELIGSVRKHLADKYGADQITWLTDTMGEPLPRLTIASYPRSLRQVILNLLINSVESCKEAGRPVAVGVQLVARGNDTVITVVDHGPGIARKDLKKVFTPFYTTRQGGSGLGLYLSRKIVKQMGGEMTIHSEPNQGTEVTITLPKEPRS